MDGRNLFNDGQHGFRRGRSCLSQLLEQHQYLINILENKKVADVVHLDFSKAFDKVDHNILLRKMQSLGIGGELIRWIENFLRNRKQLVAVDGFMSGEETLISGVPQGSVLGPLLFLLHIGDIDHSLHHATASSFADDTRITMKICSREDCDRMQNDLRAVYDWARVNNMDFNETKFEHIRFGPSEGLTGYTSANGTCIQTCQSVKDLGVIISEDMKFEDQISDMVRKARRHAGLILRVFETREKTAMLTLFKSIVIPLLEYCCQLWSPRTIGLIRKVEAVQRSFTYRITGMKDLDYWERLAQLNLYSLERRRDRYYIVYVWKIINGVAPNFSIDNMAIKTRNSPRRGLTCEVPPVNRAAPQRLQTIKEHSFMVHGPKLFNAIPRGLREFNGTLNTFKRNLDIFLRGVPDKPALAHYNQAAANNGLLEQLAQQRIDDV